MRLPRTRGRREQPVSEPLAAAPIFHKLDPPLGSAGLLRMGRRRAVRRAGPTMCDALACVMLLRV